MPFSSLIRSLKGKLSTWVSFSLTRLPTYSVSCASSKMLTSATLKGLTDGFSSPCKYLSGLSPNRSRTGFPDQIRIMQSVSHATENPRIQFRAWNFDQRKFGFLSHLRFSLISVFCYKVFVELFWFFMIELAALSCLAGVNNCTPSGFSRQIRLAFS